MASNLDIYKLAAGDDEAFNKYLDESGAMERYKAVKEFVPNSASFRRRYELDAITGKLTNSSQDAIRTGLPSSAVMSQVFKSEEGYSYESFDKSARKWGEENIKIHNDKSSGFDAGVKTFLTSGTKGYREELEKQKAISPAAAEGFLSATSRFSQDYGDVIPVARQLFEKSKAEGSRELFGEKQHVNVNVPQIVELYKAGRRDDFLFVMGKLIESEGVEVDGTLTRTAKAGARTFEDIKGGVERMIDDLRTNFNEGKVNEFSTEYDRAFNRLRADLGNLKGAIANIEPRNDFEKMGQFTTSSLVYMAGAATGVGLTAIAASTGQDAIERMMEANPDLSYTEAYSAGLPIGIITAGIERLKLGGYLGKFPFLQKQMDKLGTGSLTAMIVKRGTATFLYEYGQETLQEAVEPLILDIASKVNEKFPEGDWDVFKVLDYDRFLGVLPLSLLSGGGQGMRDNFTNKEVQDTMSDIKSMELSGATTEEAAAIAEVAKNDPDKALQMFKDVVMTKSIEERKEISQDTSDAMRSEEEAALKAKTKGMSAKEGDVAESTEFDDYIPTAIRTPDGKFQVEFPGGRREIVDTREEVQLLINENVQEDFVNNATAIRDAIDHFKERAEGDNTVTMKKRRSFQEIAETGEQTVENLKKAVAQWHAANGMEVPANIDLNKFFEQGSVRLRSNMAGAAVRIAKHEETSPLTVHHEFSEGFLQFIVARGETTFDEVKGYLDEFSAMSGLEIIKGYEGDPERAVIEGFSDFAQAYLLQGKYDSLPESNQAWMRKAWKFMENPDSIPGPLRAALELFTKLLKSVYDVAKAIEWHRQDGNGINPQLEGLAMRALGLDENAYNERMQEQYQKELLEETFDPSEELSERVKGNLPHPSDLEGDPLQAEVQGIWDSMSKETRRKRKDGKRVVSDAKARNFFAKKGEGQTLDDLRRNLNEDGFRFATPAEMLDAIQDSVEGNKVWPVGSETIYGRDTYSISPEQIETIKSSHYISKPNAATKRLKTLYRGSENGAQSDNFDVAQWGSGLYFTANKEMASEYGTVEEIPLSVLPKNPLVFDDENTAQAWLGLVVQRRVLNMRQREFSEEFPDLATFIRDELGYDGVQIGQGKAAMWVSYPEEQGGRVTFSISPAQDTEYLTAVEAGDLETAQAMVDEAARNKGLMILYHGTRNKDAILKSGLLKAAAEPAVYLTTSSEDVGYGEPIRLAIPEDKAEIDDEFPNGREDYRVEIGYGKSLKVKSADPVTYDESGNVVPLSERFNEKDDRISFSISPAQDGFYSQLRNVLDSKIQGKQATPEQIKAIIDPSRGSGVKAEEIKWSGIEAEIDRLASENGGKVPKADLLAHMDNEGQVRFEEVVSGYAKTDEVAEKHGILVDYQYGEAIFTDKDGEEIDFEDLPDAVRESYENSAGESKYTDYQLPGGENYREVVLAMPAVRPVIYTKANTRVLSEKEFPNADHARFWFIEAPEQVFQILKKNHSTSQDAIDYVISKKQPDPSPAHNYTSSHFNDIPNYVAHMRTNEREGGLFIEEIQSDRHQEGRKQGYQPDMGRWLALTKKYSPDSTLPANASVLDVLGATKEEVSEVKGYEETARSAKGARVPDAPFRTSWPLAMFKRALRDAVESGKEWIGWTVGEVHSNRWGTERIEWAKQDDGSYLVNAKSQHGGQAGGVDLEGEANARSLNKENSQSVTSESELIAAITPELTEGQDPQSLGKKLWGRMQSEDSGVSMPRKEGLEGFYDNILPKEVQKYVKQWGGKVEPGKVESGKPFIEGRPSSDGLWSNGGTVSTVEEAERIVAERERQYPDAEWRVGKRETTPIWRMDITPEMRESIAKTGQTTYSISPASSENAEGAISRLFAGPSGMVETGQKLRKKLSEIRERYETKMFNGEFKNEDVREIETLNAVMRLNAVSSLLPKELQSQFGASLSLDADQTPDEILNKIESTSKDVFEFIAKIDKKFREREEKLSNKANDEIDKAYKEFQEAKDGGDKDLIHEAAQKALLLAQTYQDALPGYPFGPVIAKARDMVEDVIASTVEIEDGIRIREPGEKRYSGITFKMPEFLKKFSIAKWVQRNLTSRGNLTPEQYRIKLASEGINLAELKRAELINARLKKAVAKEAKVAPNPNRVLMDDFLMRRVQEALVIDEMKAGYDAIARLPKSLQKITTEMREHIDFLSRKMIEAGIAKGELKDVFERNMGSYLNRSYRRFTRPETWKNEVSQEARDGAKKWLLNNLPSEAFNGDTSVDDQLEGYVDTLLNDSVSGGFTDQMNWLLGQKHVGNLIARKDVPVELRELWGEYKRGDENYMISVRKMAAQIGNHTMLSEFLKQGLGTEVFETPRRGYSTQVTSEGSSTLSPLDGYYVSEGMGQALKDFAEQGKKVEGWLKWWLKFNSTAKVTKTIYNPTTHVRNFSSNFIYVGANGNLFAYLKFSKGSAVLNMKEIFKSMETSQDIDDRIVHYVRLGVMQQGAISQEFKDILKDFSAGDVDLDEYSQNKLKKLAKFALDKVQAFYQAEDDFHKVVAFEAERAKLAKAKPKWDSQKLDAEAAQVVRNTMPDYSQVPNAVKALRRIPLIGTFTSFTSEVIRNNINIVARIKEELQDPDLRAVGATRMASFMTAHAVPLMAAYYLKELFGVDDEEDEATRAIAAPWDKYSQLLYIGRTPSGDPQYINIGYTDPFSLFKTPFFVSQQDGFSPTSVAKGLLMGLEPFYSREIGTAALMEVSSNQNDYGKEIYNPNADIFTQTKDVSAHILKAVEPGVIRSAERIHRAVTGEETSSGMKLDPMTEVTAVLTGQRITAVDRKKAILYRSIDFKNAIRDSSARFNRAWRNRQINEADLKEAVAQYKEDRSIAYSEFQDSLRATHRLGLTEDEILLEAHDGKKNTPSAKATLNLLRAPVGETPIPENEFSKGQITEMKEIEGRKELLRKIAPEMF